MLMRVVFTLVTGIQALVGSMMAILVKPPQSQLQLKWTSTQVTKKRLLKV